MSAAPSDLRTRWFHLLVTYLVIVSIISACVPHTTAAAALGPVSAHATAPRTSAPLEQLRANPQTARFLVDAGSTLQGQPDFPAPISPLALSRLQSLPVSGDTLLQTTMVTFTVTNQQQPQADNGSAPVRADPNTIHNVVLADALRNGTALLASSVAADTDGTHYLWRMGDIAPLDSAVLTLTLRLPADGVDDALLDRGATVWGTFTGKARSAQAPPLRRLPTTIEHVPSAHWLRSTIDAKTQDVYMLRQAATLEQDPLRMFAYVRSFGYEVYTGSLRGTRGTLWSQAGNALDQRSRCSEHVGFRRAIAW